MIANTTWRHIYRQSSTLVAHGNLQKRRQQQQCLHRCGTRIFLDPGSVVGRCQSGLHQMDLQCILLRNLSRRTFFATHNVTKNGDPVHDSRTSHPIETETAEKHSQRLSFKDLGLHPKTLEALQRQGIREPTEIQEKTHELIVNGHNVLGRARTGTGKTLAFLVPAIERFLNTTHQEQEGRRREPEIDEAWSSPSSSSSSSESIENLQGIPILVLAPTRELAAQIGTEAEKLLSIHSTATDNNQQRLTSQVVYGGSSKKEDLQRFQQGLPTILVATPGRLKDHLATTNLKVPGARKHIPFRKMLQNGNLQTLVLDETDRLLELGFRKEIQDILLCLNNYKKIREFQEPVSKRSSRNIPQPASPQYSRQTLLFSATLTPGIMDVVDLAILPTKTLGSRSGERIAKNYHFVDCVQNEDPTTHTNSNTKQSYIMLPPERFWTGSMELILRLMTTTTTTTSSSKKNIKNQKQKQKHKIIVFFELTSLARLYARFLSLRMGHTFGLWELHGKMHQRERSVVSRRFRAASHGVLLTSDVSARGVDYPGVTHVVQVGAPRDRETYIHRVGRTGRAGNHGEGLLILPQFFNDDHDKPHQPRKQQVPPALVWNDLEGLELVHDESLQHTVCSKKRNPHRNLLENELELLRHDLRTETDETEMVESVTLAYHSLVSYHFQTSRRRRVRDRESSSISQQQPEASVVAKFLTQLVADFGLPELPAIGFQRAKSMGIHHLGAQFNIRKNWEDQYQYKEDWDHDGTSTQRSRGGINDINDWFGLS